jgi:peptidoglycan/LPS O-acetylase OafA/YrhL
MRRSAHAGNSISAVRATLLRFVTWSGTEIACYGEMHALEEMDMTSPVGQRRYDLDWLRTFAFVLLILFHTGMMFVSWDWHVKNSETSAVLEFAMRFLHEWRMPLLFFISGAAVWFALEKYGWPAYIRERLMRLLVPLVFGMLAVIPPQVYFERQFYGWAYASFVDFYATVFASGSYPAGNLSWHHLWYIPYILTYSLLLLPLLLWLRTSRGRGASDWMLRPFSRPYALLLLCVPSALCDLCLRPFWPGDANNLVADWANLASKGVIFLVGYVLCSSEEVWPAVERFRYRALAMAIVAYALLLACWNSGWQLEGPAWVGYRILRSLNLWCWLLALLGFGRRHWSFNHPVLKYATEAVYPWYILHQTVIVIVGYHVAEWNLGMWWKYLFVAASMILITSVVYEFVIRRISLIRPLFGLRVRRRRGAVPTQGAECVPAEAR